MSTIRMHMGNAGELLDAYADTETNITSAMETLSPLLADAWRLLDDIPSPNANARFMLNNAAAALADDHLDLRWRRDWMRDTDAIYTGWNGEKFATALIDVNGDGDITLADALKEAGLDAGQIAAATQDINNGMGLAAAVQKQRSKRAEAWSNFRRQEAESWSTIEVHEPTPLEQAELSLEEIRIVLDTAKQDRGDGIGSADADGVWSTNDLHALIENEHGYYSAEQVEHARTVLAMAESSDDARDYLGITQSGGGWSFSDIGHLTLDVFGMVPVVGNAADGINAAWYAAEGEYLDAALSSIALLPGIGQAATLAKPAIKAAADGMVFRNIDDALRWAKQWLENAGIIGRGANNSGPLRARAAELLGPPDSLVVLGRQTDTGVAADWGGHTVLQASDWSLDLNDAFIDEAISQGRSIYIASPLSGNMIQTGGQYAGEPTIFARELDMLRNAGYTRNGDYLVPPS